MFGQDFARSCYAVLRDACEDEITHRFLGLCLADAA
jgi:hypothetical protein